MASAYFFKAVGSDGKVRTGTLQAQDEKWVARELKRQGLIPVYVGIEQQKQGLSLKLPSFDSGKRRDVLFFTQELSTLLNSGIPLVRTVHLPTSLWSSGKPRSRPLRWSNQYVVLKRYCKSAVVCVLGRRCERSRIARVAPDACKAGLSPPEGFVFAFDRRIPTVRQSISLVSQLASCMPESTLRNSCARSSAVF